MPFVRRVDNLAMSCMVLANWVKLNIDPQIVKYFKVFYAKFSFHINEALYGVGSVKVPDESTKRCAIRLVAKLTKK